MIDGELWTTDRLIGAGAWTAVNLDGGGSTSMSVKKTDARVLPVVPERGRMSRDAALAVVRGTRHAVGDRDPPDRRHRRSGRPALTSRRRASRRRCRRSSIGCWPMSAGPIIRTEQLERHFGEVEALKGVDLEVDAGSVRGLLGPNGAGKTTSIRILTTLLLPSAGRAEVDGLDVVKDAEELRYRIGLAGQSAAVDENLTGLENLEMVGRLYGLPKAEARSAAARSSSGSACPTRPTGRRRPTPAACAGAWTWPRASSGAPTSCSWTSRRPGSIRAAVSTCGRSSASCRPTARRSC